MDKPDAIRCYNCGDPINPNCINFSHVYPDMEVCSKYPKCQFYGDRAKVTNLGQRVKEARLQLELSLDQLAKLSGVSKPYIWSLEKGTTANPTLEKVEGLARGLGLTPQYIAGWNVDVPPMDPFALKIAQMIHRKVNHNG